MARLSSKPHEKFWRLARPPAPCALAAAWLFLGPLTLGQVQQPVSGIATPSSLAPTLLTSADWREAAIKMTMRISKARREAAQNRGSAQASLSLGLALLAAGEKSSAAEALDQALEFDGHLAQAWYLKGVMADDGEKWPLALEDFRKSLALDPGFTEARMGVAEILLRKGDFAGAGRELKIVIGGDASHPRAHYGLGRVRLQEGNLSEAETEFRRALSLQPDFPEAQEGLAELLLRRHEWQAATQLFERVVVAQPDSIFAYTGMAAALARLGQAAAAQENFAKAREISEKQLRRNRALEENNRALALWRDGDLTGARAALRSALREDADYADAHNNLGGVLWQQKDASGAIAEFTASVSSRPDYAEAHNNLGSALLQTGEIERAAREFREALSLRPGFAQAHFNLGVVLAKKGQRTEAEEELRRALILQPEMAAAHVQLGLLLVTPEGKLTPEGRAELSDGLRRSPELKILVPGEILRQMPESPESEVR